LKKADTGIQAAISTAINGFDKFLSPSIKDMTSSSSFTTNDIVKTPCILYIGFDEDAPELASLLLDINYKRMNEYLNKREKLNFDRPIHYILEEFGNLPKLDFVPKAFSRDAGKNVSCMLILQSKAQLEEIYGRNKTKELLDSTRVLIILSIAGNVEFADELSQRSGKVIRETTSKSKSKDDKDSKGSESTSDSVTLRVDRSSFLNQKVLKEIIVILQGKPAFKFDTKL
jgi:type IV secretion system protein VirD4